MLGQPALYRAAIFIPVAILVAQLIHLRQSSLCLHINALFLLQLFFSYSVPLCYNCVPEHLDNSTS